MYAKITMPESIVGRLMKGGDREKIKTVLFELYKEASILDEISSEPDDPGYFSFHINTDLIQAAYGRRDAINHQKNILITAFGEAVRAKYGKAEEEKEVKEGKEESSLKPDDDDDSASSVLPHGVKALEVGDGEAKEIKSTKRLKKVIEKVTGAVGPHELGDSDEKEEEGVDIEIDFDDDDELIADIREQITDLIRKLPKSDESAYMLRGLKAIIDVTLKDWEK